MPETEQVTAALEYVDDAGRIPLVTDGRFSGVSTGPCIGHVTPKAQGPRPKAQPTAAGGRAAGNGNWYRAIAAERQRSLVAPPRWVAASGR
jgi:hypothetical protein